MAQFEFVDAIQQKYLNEEVDLEDKLKAVGVPRGWQEWPPPGAQGQGGANLEGHRRRRDGAPRRAAL
ncbi:hypothetical protein J6590_025766 [Homalodisca vitripennis]|nr:hypothetical protein J6590_025766 [Homalodisca vitripennis]